ncbi:hypothetical protein BT96DRAFT_934533 [Gymnopus androsaceus JB14]|uniref:Uncharacterized protein n=1 Tax=Gymnopus androsaceus JB14 TaxID=1447944 RepID=A0A6A4IBE5_9AGAR|nr:hypothetical protein BT96DRAFT_934533 [Gymnopus androsaceus JB14]
MSASCFGIAKSNYGWAYNSLDQDPCAVATYLGQACNATYTIESLMPGQFYEGPDSEATPCVCSSVFYMMFSACGGCQGSTLFGSWSEYALTVNCETVYPMVFPKPIPNETSIPHWAYADISDLGGGFFASSVEALGDAPETTGGSLPALSTSSLTSTQPTSGPSASGTTNSSKPKLTLPLSISIPIFLLVVISISVVFNKKQRPAPMSCSRLVWPPLSLRRVWSNTPVWTTTCLDATFIIYWMPGQVSWVDLMD